MAKNLGKVQQKILLLLLGWVAMGLTKSPNQHKKIIWEIKKQWRKIDDYSINRAIESLYKSKLIAKKENKDGSITITLTNNGKQKALTFDIRSIKIKQPRRWDKKWRFVLFDVPEKKKELRNILRFHLKKLGFFEFQKSAFIYPYECNKEIEYIVEFYNLKEYARFMIVQEVDNEIDIMQKFDLL